VWGGEFDLDALPGLGDLRGPGSLSMLSEVEAPLWLVCCHGTRDRCCSKFGFAVWKCLEPLAPGCVWQSSHLGGHRFAAIVLALPSALMWGRVTPSQVPELHAAFSSGRVAAQGQLRGRCCYARPAQFGEIEVLRWAGLDGLDSLELLRHEPDGQGRHELEFRAVDGWSVGLTVEAFMPSGPPTPASCGDEPTKRPEFRVVGGFRRSSL